MSKKTEFILNFKNKLTPFSSEVEVLTNEVIIAIITDKLYQDTLVKNFHMQIYLNELKNRNDTPSLVKYIKNRIENKNLFKTKIVDDFPKDVKNYLTIDLYNTLLNWTESLTKRYYLFLLKILENRRDTTSHIYSLAINLR